VTRWTHFGAAGSRHKDTGALGVTMSDAWALRPSLRHKSMDMGGREADVTGLAPGALIRRVQSRGTWSVMEDVALIAVERCPLGRGVFVERDGFELAVFRLAEPPGVFVIDNTCPHAGGNLAGGEVTETIVTCPWHFWQFNLSTGIGTHSERAKVRSYPARIRDGQVWVQLSRR